LGQGTEIFKSAGFTQSGALLTSMGTGITNFLFAIPAIYTIDTFGTFKNMRLVALCLDNANSHSQEGEICCLPHSHSWESVFSGAACPSSYPSFPTARRHPSASDPSPQPSTPSWPCTRPAKAPSPSPTQPKHSLSTSATSACPSPRRHAGASTSSCRSRGLPWLPPSPSKAPSAGARDRV
jgi:hypothetical protein